MRKLYVKKKLRTSGKVKLQILHGLCPPTMNNIFEARAGRSGT